MTGPKTSCDRLIVGGLVLTLDADRRILPDGAIAIRGGRIAAIGTTAEITAQWSAPERIDAAGGVVHPGFIDGHYHAGLHLIRGALPDDPTAPPPADPAAPGAFARWINVLGDEDEHAGTMLLACEMAMNGFTGFVEAATALFPDAVAGAASAVGVRASVSDCMLWDLPDGEAMATQIPRAPCDAAHARAHVGGQLWRNGGGDPLVRGHVGVYGMGSASDDLIREAKRLADAAGAVVHQHQNFMRGDAGHDARRFGKPALVHFAEAGLIGPSSVFTHMNALTEAEAEAVIDSGMALVWHPGNTVYYAISQTSPNRFPMFHRRGTSIAFGTDVAKVWSFGDLGFIGYLHSRERGDYLPPEAVLEMFTLGGARAMGLGDDLGCLSVGRAADIVIRRADDPETCPAFDPVRQLVLIQRTKGVATVICNGEVIVKDGRPVRVDLDEVTAKARVSARATAARADLHPTPRWRSGAATA